MKDIDIQNALTTKNAAFFRNIKDEKDIETLIKFRDKDKHNAFVSACVNNCGFEVIQVIFEKAWDAFTKKLEDFIDAKMKVTAGKYEPNDEDLEPFRAEMETFFYVLIKYPGGEKSMELNVVAIAVRNHDIKTADFLKAKLLMGAVHDDFLPSKTQRKTTFGFITNKHGVGHSAKFSSKLGVIPRPPRKFHGERERQLLKQLATVLFFYIKNNNGSKKLTEIEVMHLRIGQVSHLVIAANTGDAVEAALNGIKNTTQLQDKLKTPLQIAGDVEGATRVKRYQANFSAIFTPGFSGHIFDTKDSKEAADDKLRYENILDALKNPKTKIEIIGCKPATPKNSSVAQKTVDTKAKDNKTGDSKTTAGTATAAIPTADDIDPTIKDIFTNPVPHTIILDYSRFPQDMRHAEECLVDFALAINEYKRIKNLDTPVYTSIGGKKRPCITCFSTMFNSYVTRFGDNPGYGWKSSLDLQAPANAKLTILFMSGRPTYVTQVKNAHGTLVEDPGYDSGSDADEIAAEAKAVSVVSLKK